jgi:hypothetical protein
MKMGMEPWWSDTDGKTVVPREIPVPMPQCPPQIQESNSGLRCERSAINRLSHGIAYTTKAVMIYI